MNDAKPYRTIELYGRLVAAEVDPLAVCAPGNETVPRVRDVDVVQEVDAAEAAGARSLLLHITLCGGHIPAAYRIAGRLREFAADGGRVVAFVDGQCDSCAPVVALAADFVAVDPRSWFGFHGAVGGSAEIAEREIAEIIASRSGMAIEHVAALQADGPEVVHRIYGAEAVSLGLADEIGTLERAREIAAGAPRPESERSRRLATVAASLPLAARASPGATASSESGYVGRPWISTEQRAHELALGNWSTRSVPAGAYVNGSRGPYNFVIVGNATSAAYSDYDGEVWTGTTMPNQAGVACAANDSVYVSVGIGAASSTDGKTWTGRTIAAPPGGYLWYDVAWSAVAGLFVAVTLDHVATSPDGITWTNHTVTGAWGYVADNGKVCLIAGGTATATSTDGVTWTTHANALPYTPAIYRSIICDDKGFVALLQNGAPATYYIGHSADGIAWTTSPAPSNSGTLTQIGWTGHVYALAEWGWQGGAGLFTSFDAVNWTRSVNALPSANGYPLMIASPHRTVLVCSGVNIAVSLKY
jgi:ClpP class serine protease